MQKMNIKIIDPNQVAAYQTLAKIPEVYRLEFRRLSQVETWFLFNFGAHLKFETATDFDVEAAKRAGKYTEENIEFETENAA